MTNLPARPEPNEAKTDELTKLQASVMARVTAQYQHSRPLPAHAYTRPGLGDLPLSHQLAMALSLISDTLMPLVNSVEAKQPQVVQCTVCGRNLGGWPEQVLSDHYWQHTALQRWLARLATR